MTDIVERLRNGITDGTDLRWTVTQSHLEAAAEIERLRRELSETEDNTLLSYLADIRQKSGVGIKPMLSELGDAIAAAISDYEARIMSALVQEGKDNG